MRLTQSLPQEYHLTVPLDKEGTPVKYHQLSNGYPFTHLQKNTGSYLPAVTFHLFNGSKSTLEESLTPLQRVNPPAPRRPTDLPKMYGYTSGCSLFQQESFWEKP